MMSASSSSSSPFRRDCLQGKVALITGGGSGIGFEIARQLVLHGCQGVVICGRRASFLQRAVTLLLQEGKSAASPALTNNQQQQQPVATYQVCDVRIPSQCEAAVNLCNERWGRLDILINGAAGNFLALASELSPKGFATVMAIDALGTFNISRAAHALMKKKKRSDNDTTSSSSTTTTVIINISATLQSPATFWQVHASAAKSAVDSLTRSLALEWGSDGIRVVGIAPGPIADTPGTTKLAPSMDADAGEEVANRIAQEIPLQRLGHAWEIGLATIYISTAEYLTGDVVIVDGGQWLYKPSLVPKEFVSELSRKVESKSRAQAPKSEHDVGVQHQSNL